MSDSVVRAQMSLRAERSDNVLRTLCTRLKLVDHDLDKMISDLHLDEIARTRCDYWRSLPSRLGLPDIVAMDIDEDYSEAFDRRRAFFRQWKQIKGSEATYRSLVRALLGIRKKLDAEYVLRLLRQSVASSGMHYCTQIRI